MHEGKIQAEIAGELYFDPSSISKDAKWLYEEARKRTVCPFRGRPYYYMLDKFLEESQKP
jgi:uncharacterized protein (DUF427 family)